MKKAAIIILLISLFNSEYINAQDQSDIDQLKMQINALKPGQSRFLLRGYAHSGFEVYKDESSFVGGSFNPIFLWQQSERLLFEAELEIELENGETNLALEYANMAYILNKWATLRLGKFLLPFGIFSERIHPRWINPLPSNPLGFGHESVGPASDLGVELRGGTLLETSKINYALYVTNGPRLNDGSMETEEGGILHYDNTFDNNKDKAIGGRFGLLPFSKSSLEVGISGQFAKVGDSGSNYENVDARLYSLDLSYIKKINSLKGVVDVRAQWNRVEVSDADYPLPEEPSETYTFENKSDAYFAQFSFKPAYIEQTLLKNLELVGRYSGLKLPQDAHWGIEEKQWTFGINYWIDWRSVIKIAYQKSNIGNLEEDEHGEESSDAFLVHWSFGF